MSWRTHLQERLLAMQPASVCALDEPAVVMARGVLPATPVRLHRPGQQPESPSALALGIESLNGLQAREAEQLIHHTRTFAAPRLLLVAQAGCTLDESSFRALGFTLSLFDPAENLRVYQFDIDTYKTVPDWLNARHWAHPERWRP